MVLFALGLMTAIDGQVKPAVTIESLLNEMADRAVFAQLPRVPYRQLQASSYDRAQTDPKDPKTWFANADYGQFIRTEVHEGRTEWVAMEHQGPGAITRIWTPLLAEKDKMLVRFYFDGSDQPTIEEPFNDLMRGRTLFKPPFAFISWADPKVTAGVGSDLYYPLPFAKSCKVTFSELPFYYSISYRAYPKNVMVETWSKPGILRAAATANRTAVAIGQPIRSAGASVTTHRVILRPGGDFALKLPIGSGAIRGLKVKFDRPTDFRALRSNVIKLRFDGEQTVWCPIGEFFGAGVRNRAVWDRFRWVDGAGGMGCVWTMPYQKSAEVGFHNYGKSPVSFSLQLASGSRPWDTRSLHFHATWRGQYPLATRPFSDWNYLLANGKGIYVGDTLTVFSPVPAWYGEGDERVYQEGEKFPSHLGTGTEDYYGYAWGMAQHYSSAYLAMPQRDMPGQDNWTGYTTTSRIRGLDAIPFDRQLQFDMEIWNWADCKVAYSAATFWYARPGARTNRTPMPVEASAPLPEYQGNIKGAIECETMKVLNKSEGADVSTQSGALTEGTWSNNTQLFIQAKKIGDFVDLQLPVAKAGRYHLVFYGTKSYDYGVVLFSVNGKPTQSINLYSKKPVATGPIDLGVVDLKKGPNVLKAVVVGTDAQSTGGHLFFGLDCVVLKPVLHPRSGWGVSP
jgi:hypothetical protein